MDLDLSDVRDLIRNTGIDKHNIMCNKFKRQEYKRHKKQRNNIANSAESKGSITQCLEDLKNTTHEIFPIQISRSFWAMLECGRELVVQSRKRHRCSNQRLKIQCNSDGVGQNMDQGSMDPFSGPGPWTWSIVLPIQKVSRTFAKANLRPN